jgi:hypothetical protein
MTRDGATVFEKVPGSGIWWVRCTDRNGKKHIRKVGRKITVKAYLKAWRLRERALRIMDQG